MTKQASTELAQETTGKGRLSGATEFSPSFAKIGTVAVSYDRDRFNVILKSGSPARSGAARYPSWLLLAFLIICLVNVPSKSQNLPSGAPPDVQKIMEKMKSGQPPTPAEMKRLQDWATQLNSHLNTGTESGSQFLGPAGQKQQQGIPCRIEVSMDYTGARPGGAKETLKMNVWTKAVLYADLKGTGDYDGSALDPSVPVSSFRFEPYAPGGQLATTGGGGGTMVYRTQHETNSQDFQITTATFTAILVTTGHGDSLFANVGGMGAKISGNRTVVTDDGSRQFPVNGTIPSSLPIPFADESRYTVHVGQPTPTPKMNLSYRALADAVRAGKTASVEGNEAFDFEKNGVSYSGNSSITITLHPVDTELLIEPSDEALYEKWLPVPDGKESGNKEVYGDPQPIPVHLVLVDSSGASAGGVSGGPTKPNTEVGTQIDVYLQDVSQIKGISMNYPKEGDTKPDLFFPREQPDGIEYIDEGHVQTKSNVATEATVLVAARDSGAYGVLIGKALALNLESKNKRTNKTTLSLPMDDNNNHIADQWEKDHKIYGKKLPPGWDEEDNPSGMKKKGDGLALFEEYRGFLVEDGSGNEVFRRLSPEHKKLFIHISDDDKALKKKGVDTFGAATGFEILYIHSADRLANPDGSDYPRWVTFNQTIFNSTNQDAVWIIDDHTKESPGRTEGISGSNEADPQTPATTRYVNVSRSGIEDQMRTWTTELQRNPPFDQYAKAAVNLHLDLPALARNVPRQAASLVNEMIVFITIHELGHATGGRHHGVEEYSAIISGMSIEIQETPEIQRKQDQCYSSGSKSCPMRYWNVDKDYTELLLYLSGQWDPGGGPASGGQWKFCADDWPNMSIKP